MMKNIFFLSLSFIFLGCPDKPCTTCPSPATDCDYTAGNRSFTWRLDTVAWWPSDVGGVWAFSDTDAWVMGKMYGPTVPGQVSYAGLHWDGNFWKDTVRFLDDIFVVSNDVTGDQRFMVAAGYRGVAGIKATIAEFDNLSKQWTTYKFDTLGELRSVWTDGRGYFIAAGDNGMVYTKDGYSADWVYQNAPTEFGFYHVIGISKDEIYMSAYQSLATGEFYTQGWKLGQRDWEKLFDIKDTTGTPMHLLSSDYPNEMGASRCGMTDSLKLYVIGDESFLFESLGQDLNFRKTNLSSLGLPLKASGRAGIGIDLFSPSDFWVIGTRYNFYHWNGSNFAKMSIPNLPSDDTQFGTQRRIIKTASGKIFGNESLSG